MPGPDRRTRAGPVPPQNLNSILAVMRFSMLCLSAGATLMGFGLVLVGAARSSPTPALTRRTDAGSFFKIVLVKIAGFDPRAIRRKISPIPGLPATHMGWISAPAPETWALSAHRRRAVVSLWSEWWCLQSQANRSPPKFPVNREYTGKIWLFLPKSAICTLDNHVIPATYGAIP